MPLLTVLGPQHTPKLVYDLEKESYVADRAGLMYQQETYGDEMPGVKGHGVHVFAAAAEGDAFLTVKEDATVLKNLRPTDYGLDGVNVLDGLLVKAGPERFTVITPAPDTLVMAGRIRDLGFEPVAHVKGIFQPGGPLKDYTFNPEAPVEKLSPA